MRYARLVMVTSVIALLSGAIVGCALRSRTASKGGLVDIESDGRGAAIGDMGKDGAAPAALELWQEFGETHVLVSITVNASANFLQGSPVVVSSLADEYRVSLERSDGSVEEVFVGNFAGDGSQGEGPRSQVAAVSAQPEEPVTICLSLRKSDGEIVTEACQSVVLVPGSYGQILWQVSPGACTPGDGAWCPQPIVADGFPGSATQEGPLFLSLYCTFALSDGTFPMSDRLVVFNTFPPVSCSEASSWFSGTLMAGEPVVLAGCFEPVPGHPAKWTEFWVETPTTAAAIGLAATALALPGAVPAGNLWEVVWGGMEPEEPIVGVSLGEIGANTADQPCEWWACP